MIFYATSIKGKIFQKKVRNKN